MSISTWMVSALVLVSSVFLVAGQACSSCPGCGYLAISAGSSVELYNTANSNVCSTTPATQPQLTVYVSSSDSGFSSDNWQILVTTAGTLTNAIAASGSGQNGYCYVATPFLSPDNGIIDFSFHCNNGLQHCDINYSAYSISCMQRGSAQSYMCTHAQCNAGDTRYLVSSSVPGFSFCYCEPVGAGNTTIDTYSWVQTSPGACSTTCGAGTITTVYACENGYGQQVASSYCSGPSPAATTSCTSSSSCSTTVSSTASSASTASPPWVGTYEVKPGCSLSSCCCLKGRITVTEVGSNLMLQGSVAGSCGGATSTTLTAPYPSGYSVTILQTGAGDSQTITLSQDGSYITALDNTNPQCSGSAVRTASSNGAGATRPESLFFIMLALLLALAGMW